MLATVFQAQSLSNNRVKIGNNLAAKTNQIRSYYSHNIFYNRDYLPRVCLDVAAKLKTHTFDVAVKLVDFHHTGQSSFFNNINYEIRFYSIEYNTTKKRLQRKSQLAGIDSKLLSTKVISLLDAFDIGGLKESTYYIIEVNTVNLIFW